MKKVLAYKSLINASKLLKDHAMATFIQPICCALEKEIPAEELEKFSGKHTKVSQTVSPADSSSDSATAKERVFVFSNVVIKPEDAPKVRENDVLIFLNKAADIGLYLNHFQKIVYHRSPKEDYGKEVMGCVNRYVFSAGEASIPDDFVKSLRKSYDFNYEIEDGKTKSMTTGYMVAKYMQHIYPEREIILVNFGYDVKHSTYRCPWHNWRFEAEELKQFKHIYTEVIQNTGNSKKRIAYRIPGWLGDMVIASAVIENIVASGKFSVNVIDCNVPELFDNCPNLDRDITEENADVVIQQHNSAGWQNQCPHMIAGCTMDAAQKLGTDLPISTLKPKIYLDLPAVRIIEKPYVLFRVGWQVSADVKRWSMSYWKQLVAAKPEWNFVQIGRSKNGEKLIEGAVDMIDKTPFPDLCRIIRDAACVISPPSGVIHIAGAFDTPFVSLAGGREPASLVSYPSGISLSTCGGSLECCAKGGCHRNHFSGEKRLCQNFRVAENDTMPTGECMLQITPAMVIDAVTKVTKGALK